MANRFFSNHQTSSRKSCGQTIFFLPSPKATPKECWSLGWRKTSSPLWNDEKVMIFVTIVHEMTPIVHAFLDLHGNKVSVNGVSYIHLALRSRLVSTASDRQSFSPLVDARWGSTSLHDFTFAFLNDKFEGRVISRRTDHLWPGHSPDVIPLDSFLGCCPEPGL